MMSATNSNLLAKRREYFNNLIEELKTTIEETEEVDYVTSSLYNLYSILVENEQYDDFGVDEPVISEKLIMCNRYIPNAYLDYFQVDRIVMGKLFVKAKICIMPTEMVHACTSSNRHGAIMDPEQFGLPSCSVVDYGTLRIVNSRISTALVKDSWINGWIDHNYQYEYVILNMD